VGAFKDPAREDFMRLEEQFRNQHDLVSRLRRILYIKKVRYRIIRTLLIMLSALFLYVVADYGFSYINELFGGNITGSQIFYYKADGK
jgi:hypothetical protein